MKKLTLHDHAQAADLTLWLLREIDLLPDRTRWSWLLAWTWEVRLHHARRWE